jgi:inner membrane protein
LGRAGLNRYTSLATAATVISAEIPDADLVFQIKGPLYAFQHHRGFTHTFLGIPFCAALTVLLVYGWHRWRLHRAKPPKLPPRWGLLFGFACLGALSHILLDFTNAYGVRPFMPISYRWFHWDIVSVIEPLLYVFLIGGLALPRLFALIQEEIGAKRGSGRGGAITALVLVVLVWGVRDFQHRRAVAALESLTYQGEDPVRVSAFPYEVNPFVWRGVVETESLFESVPVDTLAAEVDAERRARIYHKPEETPATLAAKKSHLGRVYLDWAAYPITEEEHLPNGDYLVRFLDLRYVYPDRPLRGLVLGSAVLLNDRSEVIGERFGWMLGSPQMRPPSQ